jgi:hypothetical protein
VAGLVDPDEGAECVDALEGVSARLRPKAMSSLPPGPMYHSSSRVMRPGSCPLRTDLHRVLLAGIEGVLVRWGQSPQAITIDGHRVVVTISGARRTKTVGGLGEAVRRCFAAVTTERLSAYHQRHGDGTPGMDVLLQAMVDPMAAGVAFTVHPPLLAATALCRVHGCDA